MESSGSAILVALEGGKLHAEKENPLRDCGQTYGNGNGNGMSHISQAKLVRGILLLLLFNMCLCSVLLGGYMYVSALTMEQQSSFASFAYVAGTGLALVVLLLMGDLSKGRPNFYYI